MIKLSRLNGVEFWINQDHILYLERVPESVLTLDDGKKLTVKETAEEVIGRILEFRKLAAPPVLENEGKV